MESVIPTFFTKTQGVVTGGPTSAMASLSLCTLTVPPVAIKSSLEVSAFWTGYNNTVDDVSEFKIHVNDIQKALQIHRFNTASAGARAMYSLPTSTLVTLAKGVGAVVKVIITRTNPSGGNITEANPGVVTATTTPIL